MSQALIEKYPDLTLVIDHMADCPVDQPAELEKLIALKRYPESVRKDLAHLVAIQAALSLAGCAGTREAPARGLRTAAADVGHRLAGFSKKTPIMRTR